MDLPLRFDKANRRFERRSDCALAVRWSTPEGRELGYVSNLSPGGFCLRTRHLHSPGYEGTFVISPESGDVTVGATVAWVRQLQVESHIAAWHEMGMRLVAPIASGYTSLLGAVENPVEERRTNRRFSHNLQVRITHEGQTFRTQSVDISRSGLLFLSDDMPPLNSEIAIEMLLPGTSAPVHVRALVVRRVEDAAESTVRGFAVRFLDLSKGEERMFINYLKIAKELRGLASSV